MGRRFSGCFRGAVKPRHLLGVCGTQQRDLLVRGSYEILDLSTEARRSASDLPGTTLSDRFVAIPETEKPRF